MSRLSDAILTGAYSTGYNRPMLDLKNGGQHGWSPNLSELISNQAYVSRPLVCIMLEAPKMFQVMPDSQKWIAALKAMFELHSRSIDGFNAGLKVDFDEHPVGGAGEMQQEFINVTRERSQPKHTFVEKYGRPIQTLLNYWIRYGMADPETKFALLGTLNNPNVKDLLADWYTCTNLYFVPDPLHKNVDKAWITTNMAPTSEGEVTAKLDRTTSQEILTLDIEFTGVSQFGYGVNQFAQMILDRINITNADPMGKKSFISNVQPDVAAVNATGYKAWTENVGSQSVNRLV